MTRLACVGMTALGALALVDLAMAADYARDGGTADWMCCADKACATVITQHADAVRAEKACGKLTDADGVTRYIRSQAFRITRPVTPAPTCTVPKPADESRSQSCPSGTTGQWTQSRTWVSAPYPTCWTAGEWTPAPAPAGTCVPVEPAPRSTWNINSGGPAYSNYTADQFFTAGTASSNCPRITFAGVFATRREHTAQFGYRVPVPNGQYTVRLLFRECYASASGQRVQSASIEGQTIPAFDTYRASNDVIIHERTVTVSDGFVDIAILPGTGMPMINGIDIAPAASPEPVAGVPINWDRPTQRIDESPFTNLAGYRIAYGTQTQVSQRDGKDVRTLVNPQIITVANPGSVSHLVPLSTPGLYYFSVWAFDTDGIDGLPSNLTSKLVQ